MFDAAGSRAENEAEGKVSQGAEAYLAALAAVDVEALPGAEAVHLLALIDRVSRASAARRLAVIKRVEATCAYRLAGDRTAAEFVARRAGTSLGEAARDLALADRLDSAPRTREGMERGEVSVVQAEHISRAAQADPASEGRLLESARRTSLTELKDEAARVVAAATDAAARAERVHRHRHLRTWTDREGAFRLAGSLTPESGAALLSALEPFQRDAFDRARREGSFEEADRYRADALVDMARAALSAGNGGGSHGADGPPPEKRRKRGRRAEMVVLVDLAALQRGTVEPGEMCEIPGVGPVDVGVAQEVLGDSLLTVVIRDGQDIRTVARRSRYPSPNQRRALLVRDRVCAIEGCGRSKGLEADHNVPWSEGGPTSLDNLCLLCRHHHRLKTAGWALQGNPGHMTLTPPPGRRKPAA